LESCKNELEKMEGDISSFDQEKEKLKLELRQLKQSFVNQEKHEHELEVFLLK
jgi:hypothetical protein